MSQQINVNIRMDKDIKEQADTLFKALGFNLTTAINTFVKQALREQAMPFQPRLKQQPLDDHLKQRHENKHEIELRKAWIEKMNNAIRLSAEEEIAEEEIIETSHSTDIHGPVNLAD